MKNGMPEASVLTFMCRIIRILLIIFEIQTTNTGDLPKRSRYYQSVLDMQQLNKGEHYRNLKRTYIIFICTFDLFKLGRHVYTFENQCCEERSLQVR